MANENADRSELDKLLRKRKLSIDNANKEIFPLVDHFIAKKKVLHRCMTCKRFNFRPYSHAKVQIIRKLD